MAVTSVIERGEELADDGMTKLSTKKLQTRHYFLGIRANDRAGAMRTASRAEPLGANSFSYAWVNERLTR
jgi:hypothetical protein